MGTSSCDQAYDVVIDSSGNVYATGYTDGGLDSNSNSGQSDVFLVKYNSSGTKQWTKQIGTSTDDIARAIAIDNSNNIYVVGRTEGELDGNANSGVAYAQDDAMDFFILKYDSNGNKQ